MTAEELAVPLSRRERFRRQTCEEIKDAARQQIADAGGAGSLSLNALAKTVGMAGPSLYRYYDSRDDLLTALLVDAFSDLADTGDRAVASTTDPTEQFRAYATTYRRWALTYPELYELLFGTPVPGYVAPMSVTGPAAARPLQTLTAILGAVRSRTLDTPGVGAVPDIRPTQRWVTLLDETPGADVAGFATAVRTWTRLHGAISLELRGHTPHVVADPEAYFAAEVEDLLHDACRQSS